MTLTQLSDPHLSKNTWPFPFPVPVHTACGWSLQESGKDCVPALRIFSTQEEPQIFLQTSHCQQFGPSLCRKLLRDGKLLLTRPLVITMGSQLRTSLNLVQPGLRVDALDTSGGSHRPLLRHTRYYSFFSFIVCGVDIVNHNHKCRKG